MYLRMYQVTFVEDSLQKNFLGLLLNILTHVWQGFKCASELFIGGDQFRFSLSSDFLPMSSHQETLVQWTKCDINPFSTNVPRLYPLKTSENLRLSDVFRGYRSRTLIENGLKNHNKITWQQSSCFSNFNSFLSRFTPILDSNQKYFFLNSMSPVISGSYYGTSKEKFVFYRNQVFWPCSKNWPFSRNGRYKGTYPERDSQLLSDKIRKMIFTVSFF